MTGVDIHIITPIVCLVCVFYTSAVRLSIVGHVILRLKYINGLNFGIFQGGLQAVVWTDVIQITAMFGAMALVAIKGTIDAGGFGVVWRRNMESGRIELPK